MFGESFVHHEKFGESFVHFDKVLRVDSFEDKL